MIAPMFRSAGCAGGLILVSLGLASCVPTTQSRYNFSEVGQATAVEFGSVVAEREVDITGQNSGAGGILGGAAGAAAGAQFGNGGGNIAAALGGAAIGAVAGAIAEQAIANHKGIEYTITLTNGKTITIVQNQGPKDVVFQSGNRVMVQVSGEYQRVLAADNLPEEIKRPKGIKVVD